MALNLNYRVASDRDEQEAPARTSPKTRASGTNAKHPSTKMIVGRDVSLKVWPTRGRRGDGHGRPNCFPTKKLNSRREKEPEGCYGLTLRCHKKVHFIEFVTRGSNLAKPSFLSGLVHPLEEVLDGKWALAIVRFPL